MVVNTYWVNGEVKFYLSRGYIVDANNWINGKCIIRHEISISSSRLYYDAYIGGRI